MYSTTLFVCVFRFLLAGVAIGCWLVTATQVVGQADTAPIDFSKKSATAKQNMVATVHPEATKAALEVMDDGGNAVDAAVSAALTLGVVDGYNSGIGGGCFILIRSPDGKFTAIDGREMAPAAAHMNLFRDAAKTIEEPSRTGPLASGVPGALAAFHQATEMHGRMKFSRLLRPGQQLARDGFKVTKSYASRLNSVKDKLARFPGSAAVLLRKKEGQLVGYQAGELLKQTDLANTYRLIADKGIDWFYQGPFAKQTADWMHENGGIMTQQDFANYKTVLREPVESTYREFKIVGFPPPSSGGVHVAQILNILENFDLAAMHRKDPADMYHVIGEAMKFAFADRAHWLGDPDFVNVPKGLIDQSYADEIFKKIKMDSVTPTGHGTPPGSETNFFPRHTTHIAAADREGYFVAITSTVNTTFGSKVIVPGLGVVMNNQMDDFVAIPDKPNAFGLVGGKRNAVEARKRPLSSMSPTIVIDEYDQPILTVGAAGGPKIITQVVNTIVHHLDLKKPIDKAIAAPRVHHQWRPKALMLEEGFDEAIQAKLVAKGHQVRTIRSAGICQAISFDGGLFYGAADPRTESSAAGQNGPMATKAQAESESPLLIREAMITSTHFEPKQHWVNGIQHATKYSERYFAIMVPGSEGFPGRIERKMRKYPIHFPIPHRYAVNDVAFTNVAGDALNQKQAMKQIFKLKCFLLVPQSGSTDKLKDPNYRSDLVVVKLKKKSPAKVGGTEEE